MLYFFFLLCFELEKLVKALKGKIPDLNLPIEFDSLSLDEQSHYHKIKKKFPKVIDIDNE